MTTTTGQRRVAATMLGDRSGAAAIGAAALVATALYAPHAAAANRSVCPSGCTYPTIQSAIDSANAGDTIFIGKGRYVENLNTEGKKISLQGVGDRRKTIIDGNGKGPVITITGTQPILVSDLTITRGFGDGGGISVGVAGAALSVRHSIIVSNHSTTHGGGISSDGNVTILDCNISNNDAAGNGGGLADTGEGITVDIRDSTFARNSASFGGAISVTTQTNQVNVDHTDIVDNTALQGGGVFILADATLIRLNLTNSTVSRNSATGSDGGGLFLTSGSLTSSHNVFAQNTAAAHGGAIAMDASVKPTTNAAFSDTYIIMNKSGTDGGGVSALGVPTVTGANTVIADNTPDNCPASQSVCP